MITVNVAQGKFFDDLKIGDEFTSTITLTETHLVLGSALLGDFNPVHVNQLFVDQTKFKQRIFPGPFTLGVMASALGNYFSGTAVANTDIQGKFTSPVFANDTIQTRWVVENLTFKEKLQAGFVQLKGYCTNQHEEKVVEASAVVLVRIK
ncbi:MaoC family dehydratase [Fredinandcohnia onubensis]|uniref:MaoC family dehydratase n=1 Tax=Fredinandcohnia onubensis TaxID=1571209 RepID=UPI000C0BCA9E|nr:MaoC family dehydratase [Fredinandcohnia onubensis]